MFQILELYQMATDSLPYQIVFLTFPAFGNGAPRKTQYPKMENQEVAADSEGLAVLVFFTANHSISKPQKVVR